MLPLALEARLLPLWLMSLFATVLASGHCAVFCSASPFWLHLSQGFSLGILVIWFHLHTSVLLCISMASLGLTQGRPPCLREVSNGHACTAVLATRTSLLTMWPKSSLLESVVDSGKGSHLLERPALTLDWLLLDPFPKEDRKVPPPRSMGFLLLSQLPTYSPGWNSWKNAQLACFFYTCLQTPQGPVLASLEMMKDSLGVATYILYTCNTGFLGPEVSAPQYSACFQHSLPSWYREAAWCGGRSRLHLSAAWLLAACSACFWVLSFVEHM